MIQTPKMTITLPVVGQSLSCLHPQQFVHMVTSNRHLGRSQGKANEHRHTVNLRTITSRSNLCQRLPCCVKAHANRCVPSPDYCPKQAEPWTLCSCACAHICLLASVILCLFMCVFFYTDSWLAFFPHTHKDVHTPLSAQSPVGRRPRARPHIWQESNWACLMADIQERRRERQTCSDEGEWRAISREIWFSPLLLALSQLSITIKNVLSGQKWRIFFLFF